MHFFTSFSALFSEIRESLSANLTSDLTSPHDPLDMYRYRTKFLDVPCSKPSAMFVDIDITARSICFLREYCRHSANSSNTNSARDIASCQTIRSSNLLRAISEKDRGSCLHPYFLSSSSSLSTSSSDFTFFQRNLMTNT